MRLANSEARYGTVAKLLHWLTALMILVLIPLGLIAEGMNWDTPEALEQKASLFSLHKTVGLVLFAVALMRIFWALTQLKPGPIHPERPVETFAASAVHWTLYGALVAVPLSGWVTHAATEGFAPILWPFGQGLPLIPRSEAIADAAAAMHWLGGRVLMVALALHVAGAVKHQVLDRDATLRRMWFGDTEAGDRWREGHGPFVVAAAVWFVALASALMTERTPSELDRPRLAGATAGWAVEDGTLTIGVTQFGQELAGRFGDWSAAIDFDVGTGTGRVEVTVSIPSLVLGSVSREALAPAYFDAETHPVSRFSGIIARAGEDYVAEGSLTLKGRVVPARLQFSLMLDDDTAAMEGHAVLDRRDFGIGDAEDTTLGNEVTVDVALTARRR